MPQTKIPTPEEVLAALKNSATLRMQRSLDLIHTLCTEQHQRGSQDFSVATIGRLSAARSGPAEQSIRNKQGKPYRTLMGAWAAFTDGLTRKPPARAESGIAENILDMISDPSVRAIVGVILRENGKLKGENTMLKSKADIIVDRRPLPQPTSTTAIAHCPLLPAETEALRKAISEEFMNRQGWQIDPKTGRVTTRDGRNVFTAGFATAIKKVLDSCDNS